MMRLIGSLVVVWLLAASSFVYAEAGVKLDNVPKQLTLPMPRGTNHMLDVQLTSGTAKEAWISPAENSRVRFMLSRVGDGRFRVNLGNRVLARVLHAAGASAFHVHVRTDAGRVLESTQINFAERDHKPDQASLDFSVDLLRTGNKSEGVEVEAGSWHNPDRFSGVLVKPTDSSKWPEDVSFRAVVGAHDWQFSSVERGRYLLRLSKARRRAWREQGRLRIEARQGGKVLSRSTLRARPGSLIAPDRTNTFVVHQRGRASLPGSNDLLYVQLGDITAGQVSFSLRRADKEGAVLRRQSVRQGSRLRFKYEGDAYILIVDRMVNLLVGSDYLQLELRRADDVKEDSGSDA
jgi:hypothetical protein